MTGCKVAWGNRATGHLVPKNNNLTTSDYLDESRSQQGTFKVMASRLARLVYDGDDTILLLSFSLSSPIKEEAVRNSKLCRRKPCEGDDSTGWTLLH